jgi:hypothetical protein
MDAYRWLLDEGVDASHIIVAGDSAGGNLALALLLRARDEGLPLPAGAVVLSPLTDLTFSGDSVQRNDGVDDMFSADLLEALIPVYLSQPELRAHPHVSPVFGDYAGMPPLLLMVGSTELLLDDSVRVAQRWPLAQLLVWHGMPHVFAGFDFLPQAIEATQRIGSFMRDCVASGNAPHTAAQSHVGPAPATQAKATPRLRMLAWLYLALAVAAALVSLAAFTVGPGLAVAWANPVVCATSAVAVLFMLVEASSVGRPRLACCIAANLLLGPGCGLSLFLFWRASGAAGSRGQHR